MIPTPTWTLANPPRCKIGDRWRVQPVGTTLEKMTPVPWPDLLKSRQKQVDFFSRHSADLIVMGIERHVTSC